MKYISPKNWTDLANQQGLLFFAQILNESLFDYTLDTYKPKALNIRLLCIETITTIDDVKEGLIKKPNIEHVVDELLWSLNSDFLAKKILNNQLNEIIKEINLKKNSLSELRQIIILLYHYFDNHKYLNEIKSTLKILIPVGIEKEKIYSLTKLLITELINYGYSPEYIYYITNKFFFNYSTTITINNPDIFFNFFDFKKKNYSIIYKVNKLFKEFDDVAEVLGFKIQTTYKNNKLKGQELNFINSKLKTQYFVVFNIQAIDDKEARTESEHVILKLGNMFSFYHHKEAPEISELAIVINKTDKYSILMDKPTKSIIKKSDVNPFIATQKVKNIFEDLNLLDKTIHRLTRVIDLHSIALSSKEIENKLLSLWTAVETLIPKDIECGKDRIIQIIDAIIPFQIYGYIKKLLDQAGNDFKHFDRRKSIQTIRSVVKNDETNKFEILAAFIMTKENATIRETAKNSIQNNPLLQYRLFSLNKTLNNSKSILKLLEDHKLKVEWQIRRIYRVRNLIVHSGKKPSYVNLLVEHLHNYFDDMLNYIIDKGISEKRITTINEAILDCQLKNKTMLEKIKLLKDSDIDLTNYKIVNDL
ncbi:hypothetical protein ACNFU2_05275 [Chryseobacterium sp. PTM-20240506]|uniref:hypothetical protein n=1 Tax=Chryseobacterium sp. PTM-20240506 TaxID=3400631 RepID=UPI003AAC638F